MSELEWKDPPPPPLRRVDKVAASLREHPGVWARIDHQGGLVLMSWWTPLYNDDDYEVKPVRTSESPFGPRDIYARYVGGEGADPDQKP